MILCIAAATGTNLLSARFSNRVPIGIVGLATGAVLTLLGGAMLVLNYWSVLFA